MAAKTAAAKTNRLHASFGPDILNDSILASNAAKRKHGKSGRRIKALK
jgi:hypothetical protein